MAGGALIQKARTALSRGAFATCYRTIGWATKNDSLRGETGDPDFAESKPAVGQLRIGSCGGTPLSRPGKDRVDLGEQLETRILLTAENPLQVFPPFIGRSALFSGKDQDKFGKPPAHGKLATGAFEPGIEIGFAHSVRRHAGRLADKESTSTPLGSSDRTGAGITCLRALLPSLHPGKNCRFHRARTRPFLQSGIRRP